MSELSASTTKIALVLCGIGGVLIVCLIAACLQKLNTIIRRLDSLGRELDADKRREEVGTHELRAVKSTGIRRKAFTLIELMVAMALTLLIMIVLSQAFIISMETFSRMKGIGDMQVNLRTATTLLRTDLSQDHFEGVRRLSDTSLLGNPSIVSQPPQAGFLAVIQRSALLPTITPPTTPTYYYNEGADPNGLASYRATDHILYMTVKRKGNRQEDFFTASLTEPSVTALPNFFSRQTAYNVSNVDLPNLTLAQPYQGGPQGFYSSQWAEVIYYLKRTGSTEEPNNPASQIGTPTFQLCRAEFVMVPDGTSLRSAPNPFVGQPNANTLNVWNQTIFQQMSTNVVNVGATTANFQLQFLSPADAAQGARLLRNTIPTVSGLTRFNPLFGAGNAGGAPDVARVALNESPVMPNVVSFQLRVLPIPVVDSATKLPPAYTPNLPYRSGDWVSRGASMFVAIADNGPPGAPVFPGGPPANWQNSWRLYDGISFMDLPNIGTAGGLYDTTMLRTPVLPTPAGTTYNNNVGLKAIQVTLRVFDPKTRQTRQVTVTHAF